MIKVYRTIIVKQIEHSRRPYCLGSKVKRQTLKKFSPSSMKESIAQFSVLAMFDQGMIRVIVLTIRRLDLDIKYFLLYPVVFSLNK